MNNVNYFEKIVGSISDFRKIVILLISIKNYTDLLEEFGFVEK